MAFDNTQDSHRALKKVFAERTSTVVAWVGAGLSAPAGLPSWVALLDDLISVARRKHATMAPDAARAALEGTLIEEKKKKNFWLCFQLLEQLLGPTSYQAEIRERLDTSTSRSIPPAYSALWKTGIQGMITFNLDQFASRSYSMTYPGAAIDHFVGEQSKNLAGVLQHSRPFVGNVHGVIDNVGSWIFTHDKLTKLLKNDGYRQFVNSCLLSRTILFAGVSADDIAVHAHLEAVHKAGITGISHFWLTSQDRQRNGRLERKVRHTCYSVRSVGQRPFGCRFMSEGLSRRYAVQRPDRNHASSLNRRHYGTDRGIASAR
ncbi:MAG: SIR2 family protein [Pseudorhodoferax sp.]